MRRYLGPFGRPVTLACWVLMLMVPFGQSLRLPDCSGYGFVWGPGIAPPPAGCNEGGMGRSDPIDASPEPSTYPRTPLGREPPTFSTTQSTPSSTSSYSSPSTSSSVTDMISSQSLSMNQLSTVSTSTLGSTHFTRSTRSRSTVIRSTRIRTTQRRETAPSSMLPSTHTASGTSFLASSSSSSLPTLLSTSTSTTSIVSTAMLLDTSTEMTGSLAANTSENINTSIQITVIACGVLVVFTVTAIVVISNRRMRNERQALTIPNPAYHDYEGDTAINVEYDEIKTHDEVVGMDVVHFVGGSDSSLSIFDSLNSGTIIDLDSPLPIYESFGNNLLISVYTDHVEC